MPIAPQEIAVGVVAYFDVNVLDNAPNIQKPPSPTTRSGPFLCVQIAGEWSVWAPLTWTVRPERLLIKPEWREGGTAAWRNRSPYLNDGATTYVGDTDTFIAASATADKYIPSTRQRVSALGVEAVVSEIKARGGRLL